jgi:hypothetical protein
MALDELFKLTVQYSGAKRMIVAKQISSRKERQSKSVHKLSSIYRLPVMLIKLDVRFTMSRRVFYAHLLQDACLLMNNNFGL